MTGWISDVRIAIRSLAKSKGFALLVVATVALGIGANTAMFSIVRGLLLRPLPYRDPGRLMVAGLSYPDYEDLRSANRSFDKLAIWASNLYNMAEASGDTEQIRGALVSTDFFPILSGAALGRTLLPEDARAPVAVISDRLWRERFAADPAVLGRALTLSGKTYTVVGVMPPAFEYPSSDFSVWLSFDLALDAVPEQARNRSLRIFRALAHVRPGVPERQAVEEVLTLSRRLEREHPDSNSGIQIRFRPLSDALLGGVRPALLVLLATVGIVLLIACANVANLMLSRMAGRKQDLAIRSALGAGRARLVRQMLTECVVLSVAGGVVGVAAAVWCVALLPRFAPASLPRLGSVRVDSAILLFAAGISVATGILFGLVPALQASRASLSETLKEAGRGSAGSRPARRLRNGLIVVEVGLSVVVLVGAGLFLRSLDRLLHVESGFEASNLLTFSLELARLDSPERRARAAEDVLDRLSKLPGVVAAGGGTGLPPESAQRGTEFRVPGLSTSDPDERRALFLAVSPDYFRALGTRVVEGRTFGPGDRAGAPSVAVISRGLARRLFPRGGALGRTLELVNREYSPEPRTIVGVVDNVRYSGLDDPGDSAIYTPFQQTPFLWTYLMVRTSGAPEGSIEAVRQAVKSVDPSLVAARPRAMERIVSGSVAQPRFQAALLSAFGLLALVLAAVGIYGVISYGVAARREELGVRMALGASSSDVLRLITGQAMRVVGLGLTLGAAGALAGGRILQGLLFEVQPSDPLTFAAIAAVIAAVGLLASGIPAWRATRLDPVDALRQS